MPPKKALIAFSGGLDTSFLAAFARGHYKFDEIITVTVNTGGFDTAEKARIAARSKEVGADRHILLEAEDEFYRKIIKFLIFGNTTRDGYPLCVGAERLIQAEKALQTCISEGAQYLLHGSTGAGNDQYRFDTVVHVLGQGKVEVLAPVRDMNISREQSAKFLDEAGISVPQKSRQYSYNAGLWGVSIGGTETHTSTALIPDSAWYSQGSAEVGEASAMLEFHCGELAAVECASGSSRNPVEIIRILTQEGNRHSIGRHYHTGTSIPGKKGRLAYESPAADIIYEAHRTLEKITLTQAQISGKKPLAEEFGRLIHEAKYFDPYLKDIQAFLLSSQARVTGKCEVILAPGYIKSVTADSPWNLLGLKGATYGEVSESYSGQDALGACKLSCFEQKLYHSLSGHD